MTRYFCHYKINSIDLSSFSRIMTSNFNHKLYFIRLFALCFSFKILNPMSLEIFEFLFIITLSIMLFLCKSFKLTEIVEADLFTFFEISF